MDGEPSDRGTRRITATYRPLGIGLPMALYAGDLEFLIDGKQHVVSGQLELRLGPSPTLVAHLAGNLSDLDLYTFLDSMPGVSVPSGSQLDPPDGPVLPQATGGETWSGAPITVHRVVAGDVASAERFVLHISGAFHSMFPVVDTEDGLQHQLPLSLPDWNLVLAQVEDRVDDDDFVVVVEAVPVGIPATEETIRRLQWRLFKLLSLIATREVGVGPISGLNARSEVVWADLAAPRVRHGDQAIRWCPTWLAGSALTVLAGGFAALKADTGLVAVVDRAIGYLLAAVSEGEVLDVRIPVACSGLELLGWAILQRHGGLRPNVVKKLSAGEIARQVIEWAGVPSVLPAKFDALADRRARIGEPDWEGPEVLFSVRNKLVHPPNRLDSLEWPKPEELWQAWQLATWYLELVVLRVLGYEGSCWSRIRLDDGSGEVELVPWAATRG